VVEILAVRVEEGCYRERYPFAALLYQSVLYERYKTVHFGRQTPPSHMDGVGSSSDDHDTMRQSVLWDYRYLSE